MIRRPAAVHASLSPPGTQPSRLTRMGRFSLLLVAALLQVALANHAAAEMVVVVNPQAPVKSFSMNDLRQIYLGRMQLFPGTNENIKVLDQHESTTNFTHFYRTVTRMNAMKLTRYRASFLFSGRGRLPEALRDDKAVLKAVKANRNAMGYLQRDVITDDSVYVVMSLP